MNRNRSSLPSMTYCFNPRCPKPQNPARNRFCQNCGAKLLLKDRYRAIELLDPGGFGRTFKAVDRDYLNHICAVKQFLLLPEQNQKTAELLNQEVLQLYQLGQHDQIPTLYTHVEQDNCLYLIQELIDGQNLADELHKRGTKSESEIRELLIDLLPVLKFMHEKGIIHQDIKPENILRRQSDRKLVLVDFGGIKRLEGIASIKAGVTLINPGYAPLEQRYGQACHQSDLYSLGVTCIRLITGILPSITPYGDLDDQLFDPLKGGWVWQERLPNGMSVSSHLGEILDKLLQDLVKDRYQSADEVLQALDPSKVAATTISAHLVPNPTPIYQQGEETWNVPLHSSKLQDSSRNGSSENGNEQSIISNERSSYQTTDVVPLESERGIDYVRLRNLLIAKRWAAADRETQNKMLEMMGQQQRGYLLDEDIEILPRKDIHLINDLWMHYSGGRFGFSVQKHIWIEEGGKPGQPEVIVYKKFGDRVGWRVNNEWKNYSDLTFTSNASPGHLPSCGFVGIWVRDWGICVGLLTLVV